MNTTTLPPGKYFIGDPCYMFDQDNWKRVVSMIFSQPDTDDGGVLYLDRCAMFVASTAYGDGSYNGSNGFEFGVDSGLLGAVPVELMSRTPGNGDGLLVDAPAGLCCSMNRGCFLFYVVNGQTIEIKTTFDEEDDGHGF